MTRLFPLTLVLLAVTALAFGGCASESANPTSDSQASSPPEQASHAEPNDAGGDHSGGDQSGHMEMAAGSSDMDKMKTELAKLSPEDRASAEKQHFCPVSGQMLGTMGAPYKVDINGRQVWLCCSGCESQLRENPDAFLAKLQN